MEQPSTTYRKKRPRTAIADRLDNDQVIGQLLWSCFFLYILKVNLKGFFLPEVLTCICFLDPFQVVPSGKSHETPSSGKNHACLNESNAECSSKASEITPSLLPVEPETPFKDLELNG